MPLRADTVAIGIWWVLVLAVAVALWPLVRSPGTPGYVESPLLSGGGTGRWQFWQAAVAALAGVGSARDEGGADRGGRQEPEQGKAAQPTLTIVRAAMSIGTGLKTSLLDDLGSVGPVSSLTRRQPVEHDAEHARVDGAQRLRGALELICAG
jgi:hypothetical protein